MRQLKSDLAALDRKIAVELKPNDAEEAARAKVVTPTKGNGEPLDPTEQSQSPDEKKSMVAEPMAKYQTQVPAYVAATMNPGRFRVGPKY